MNRSVCGWFRLGMGLILLTLGAASTEYRYSYVPKTVYTTQVFPVTIQATNARTDREVLFRFDADAPLKPLSFTPAKLLNGHDIFYTFYFLAREENDLRLPPLTIRESNATHTLPSRSIHTRQLTLDAADNFCGLIATDCTIRSSQVSMFDANSTLVAISLQAHEANPEAIRIPGAIEEGLEKVSREGSMVLAEYYFVIPSGEKNITLSYYNTAQHRFVPTTISTDYHTRSVAAQVELNPKASLVDKLKKYGSIALAVFFALMFGWQRDRLYLVLLILVAYALYVVYRPREMLCIQEGSPLLILPTANSRSSTTVTEEFHTPRLGQHGRFYKINYHHGIIGWIRDEDLCQN